MNKLVGFLLFILLTSSIGIDNNNLDSKKLWELSPDEFFEQPMVSQEINLLQPNDYLLSIAIFQATNDIRAEFNLSQLSPNRTLHLAGAKHISEMRKHDFFAHDNPYNSQERGLMQRIKNQGGGFRMAAENLALLSSFNSRSNRYSYRQTKNGYQFSEVNGQPIQPHTYESFAKEVVWEWYESRGHRRNLLDPDFTSIGIAVHIQPFNYQSKKLPYIYAVQEFGG